MKHRRKPHATRWTGIAATSALLLLPQAAGAADLVSHYLFKGAADDTIVNEVEGAPDGAIVDPGDTISFTEGPVEFNPQVTSAITFDNSTEFYGYVDLGVLSPPIAGVNLPADGNAASGSLALWIRSTQTTQGAILGVTNPGVAQLFQLAVNSDFSPRIGLGFRDADGTGLTAFNNDLSFRDGTWHHYAFTWEIADGSLNASGYLDGFPIFMDQNFPAGGNEVLDSTYESPWQVPMFLGNMNNRGAPIDIRFFAGDIADLRIYSGELTEEEVQAILTPSASTGFAAFMDGFPTLTVAEKSPDADPDGDGIPNLVEYALAALDPAAPDFLPSIGAGRVISFAKRPAAVSAGDVTYTIETSATPAANPSTWQPATPDSNDSSAVSLTLPPGLPAIFARLRVSIAATPAGLRP